MNLSDEDLECLRSGLTESIRERPLIARVVGSFARGEEVRSSDLDLMIQISRAMTFSEMASLREWFDASNLPYIVDLVDYHQVAPERLSRMLKGACVILDY